MRTLLTLCLVALSSALQASEPDYAGVFQMGGGTASCIDGHYLITCIHGLQDEHQFVWGPRIQAKVLVRSQYDPSLPMYAGPTNNPHRDGVAVWYLSGKEKFKSLRLAKEAPERGDTVRVPGYGLGHYSLKTATVLSVGRHMTLNQKMEPGDSGAPVLNVDGEVVGVITHTSYQTSMAVPWHVVSGAVAAAKEDVAKTPKAAASEPKASTVQAREVIAFLTSGCTPCDYLKRDIAAGHFRRFNLRTVTYNRATRTWSDGGKAIEEFYDDCGYEGTLAFPVVWVKGTGQYKAGYQPERRGGLISFIGGLIEGVVGLVIGQNETQVDFPKPYRRNRNDAGQLPESAAEGVPGPDSLESDSGDPAPVPEPGLPPEIEAKVERLLADVDDLKNGNIFQKTKAFRDLKSQVDGLDAKSAAMEIKSKAAADGVARIEELGISDAIDSLKTLKDDNASALKKMRAAAAAPSNLKQTVGGLKQEISDLRDRKDEYPLEALWGLLALVSGVIHEITGEKEDE